MARAFKEYRVAGQVLVHDNRWRSVPIEIGTRQHGLFHKPEIFLGGQWWRTEIVETPRGLEIVLPAELAAEGAETINTRFRVRQISTPDAVLRRLGLSETDIAQMTIYFSESEMIFLASFLSEADSGEILVERTKLAKLSLENKIREKNSERSGSQIR